MIETRSHAQPEAAAPSSFTPVRSGGMLQRKCACGGSAGLAKECEGCNEQKLSLQRSTRNAEPETRNPGGVPPIVNEVLRSPGQPLDAETRAFMEPRFGHDFSRVRVHADTPAAESAQSVNALAYTVGRDIVFGAGQYAPGTQAGQKLIAHELTHTIQQGRGLSGNGISHPADSSEREAERVAKNVIVGGAGGPSVPEDANALIQRSSFDHDLGGGELTGGTKSVVGNGARESFDAPFKLQRAPDDEGASPAGSDQPGPAAPGARGNLIVEDNAAELAEGQMRKSAFLGEVQAAVSPIIPENKADAFNQQFEVYSGYDSNHLERDIHTYAPETTSATAASEYIPAIRDHITHALASEQDSASEATESTGEDNASPAEAPVMAKREGGSQSEPAPSGIQSQLSSGQALDSGAKSRMESVFGYDFSRVHVHTNAEASTLSSGLNARAFTVGSDIAFAAGEYQPGTLIGDALLAHELAHVVQQGGGSSSSASMQTGDAYQNLEEDADQSAIGAMIALWGGAKGALADIAKNAMPSLRSGLRLQRCNGGTPGPTGRISILYRRQFQAFEGSAIYCACAHPTSCRDREKLTVRNDTGQPVSPIGREVEFETPTCRELSARWLSTNPCPDSSNICP